jgi:3-oxoacyl-[acyl-carrier-protein] synthase III
MTSPVGTDSQPGTIGISAIATWQPPWSLANDWFGETIARKFVHHTGIQSRRVSLEDEVSMAVLAARNLQQETGCDFGHCAGLIFASPSFIPLSVARQHLTGPALRDEHLKKAARRLARRLGIAPHGAAVGINWFCSGYSRALALASRRLVPALHLGQDQFVLVVTATRISRITDYSCKQTGALFGDLATATLLARTDSPRYPVHFELLYADARKQPADGVYFDFHRRENVLAPVEGGGRSHDGERLVFSLDGMGIADVAPRAMTSATAAALEAASIRPEDVRFVIPHQAGAGIVRLTAMKLDGLGIRCEVVNGLTAEWGNVSAGSIPLALKARWNTLSGTIACPTAAVGNPGAKEVSQGCILLRATPRHDRQSQAAA